MNADPAPHCSRSGRFSTWSVLDRQLVQAELAPDGVDHRRAQYRPSWRHETRHFEGKR
jgi:hypothetical protein